jgi:hypothetical protein
VAVHSAALDRLEERVHSQRHGVVNHGRDGSGRAAQSSSVRGAS